MLQRQLAAQLEIDTPMFCKIERGERRAKREHVIKLAEYLHQMVVCNILILKATENYFWLKRGEQMALINSLRCERLSSNEENLRLIDSFYSVRNNNVAEPIFLYNNYD